MDIKLDRLKELSFGLKLILVVSLIVFSFNLLTQYQWLSLIDGIRGAIDIGIFSSLLGLFMIGVWGVMFEDATNTEVKFQSKTWKHLLALLYFHYKLHPKLTTGIYILYFLPALYFYAFFSNLLSVYTKWGDMIWANNELSFYNWNDVLYLFNWLTMFLILSISILAGLYLSKKSKKPILYKLTIFATLIVYWVIFWIMAFGRSRY